MSIKSRWSASTISQSAQILNSRDRKLILVVIVLQTLMGFLDLFGVALIGILGSLAVSGLESHQPGGKVLGILSLLKISHLQFQQQAFLLGTMAVIVMTTRTILSILFTRRTLHFLSRRGAIISTMLISKLLSQPLQVVQARTMQETLYSVTDGVKTITLGILGTTVTLVSDISLLLVMAAGLLIVDPVIAILTTSLFGILGWTLYKLMHTRARKLGTDEAKLNIQSNSKIIEVLSSYRESVVRNRRTYYASEIGILRLRLADTLAEISFMPNISKYVIESTVVFGALIISGVQFFLLDAAHSVGTLSIFLAAGTRIAPAALRLQQGAITIKGSLGSAAPTLELISELGDFDQNESLVPSLNTDHIGFDPSIKVTNVDFSYDNETKTLKNISFSVSPGTTTAIVGPSGAGKTTIVDLILGLLIPDTGTVLISDCKPLEAISKWSGAISYVPQDVSVISGTIRDNVAMGFPKSDATDQRIWEALKIAQLDKYVLGLPFQIDSEVGEHGARISGGQRQRLGIARAMFTKPNLLVLDEATSALDGLTESEFSAAVNEMRGETTLVVIAHRLTTIVNADQVIYIEAGEIVSKGSFVEVKNSIPDFAIQAKLQGL